MMRGAASDTIIIISLTLILLSIKFKQQHGQHIIIEFRAKQHTSYQTIKKTLNGIPFIQSNPINQQIDKAL